MLHGGFRTVSIPRLTCSVFANIFKSLSSDTFSKLSSGVFSNCYSRAYVQITISVCTFISLSSGEFLNHAYYLRACIRAYFQITIFGCTFISLSSSEFSNHYLRAFFQIIISGAFSYNYTLFLRVHFQNTLFHTFQ